MTSTTFYSATKCACKRFCLFTVLLAVLIGSEASAQPIKRTANWAYGDRLMINFTSTATYSSYPAPSMSMTAYAGCASISSENGTLLFYTNGDDIWNSDHDVMQNGSGLSGDHQARHSSIIIPKPGSSTTATYYVFYVSLAGTCYYSEVDMAADGGLGEVVSGKKNLTLKTNVAELVTACGHSNGRDIWLLLHGRTNNEFYAYLITPDGVSTGTFTTSWSGASFQCAPRFSVTGLKAENCMKFSPDGQHLVVTHERSNPASDSIDRDDFIEIFRFNNSDGKVLPNSRKNALVKFPYGVEFSPDNRLVYITGGETINALFHWRIYQIELASSKLAFEYDAGGDHKQTLDMIGSIQLGPDGRIYFVHSVGCDCVTGGDFFAVGVIKNPNEKGERSTIQHSSPGVVIPGLYSWQENISLPNFMTSYFGPWSPPGPRYCDDCFDNTSSAKVPWSTTHTITPIYAHPVCGTGITITYQTRVCNGIRDFRIIGIEIPCENNAECRIRSLLLYYEGLVERGVYPEISIQAETQVRFFRLSCWQQIQCTTSNSIIWWICSQQHCCRYNYTVKNDCYDQPQASFVSEPHYSNSDNYLYTFIDNTCTDDRTRIDYPHPCQTTGATIILKPCEYYHNICHGDP